MKLTSYDNVCYNLKKLRHRKGLVGLMILGLAFTVLGGFYTWDGITHKGNGVWTYGGDVPGTDGQVETPETTEVISQKQYRKECYDGAFIFYILSVVFLGESITRWKERNKLEITWQKHISNPEGIKDIQMNAALYRDDFKKWIKDNHPQLASWDNPPNRLD